MTHEGTLQLSKGENFVLVQLTIFLSTTKLEDVKILRSASVSTESPKSESFNSFIDHSLIRSLKCVNAGNSLYSKVIVNDSSEIFPDESMLVQTTVVVPNWNKESEGGEHEAAEY